MNRHLIMAIFRKELLETVRDRRTLFIMLVVPVVLYPMLMIGVGQIVTHQVSQLTEQYSHVAILGEQPAWLSQNLAGDGDEKEEIRIEFSTPVNPPSVPERLHFQPKKTDERGHELRFLDPQFREWVFEQIRDDVFDACLLLPSGADAALGRGETASAVVLFDATREASAQASSRIDQLLYRKRQQLVDERIAAHPELPNGFLRPFRVAWENLAPPARQGNYMVGRILPTLLVMMILLGAFYPAVDLTAGEKERGTLQTLLTSPARPMDIILGKFLTVFLVSLVAALANLVSMAAAFSWMFKGSGLSETASFNVDISTIMQLMLQLVPVGCLVSALMLAICVFARSYKEAQHYLTPVYIFLLGPIILAALPGVILNKGTAWVPILNIMLLIRTTLLDPVGAEQALMVFVANIVWAALALAVAIRVFESEEVLLGGDGAAADAFRIRVPGEGTGRPTVTLSVVMYCLGMVLLVYAGGGLQQMDIIWGTLATQAFLIAIPVVLVVRGFRLDFCETLSLRVPTAMALLGALLIGIGGWAAIGGTVGWLQNMVLPVPESFARQMEKALGLGEDPFPLWVMLTVFALAPAICEELFFRGIFLAGLRQRMGKWTVIVLCGAAFGLFHLSIYRILPTAVLGMVLAWVLWESRSIVACMLLHFCNNAAALCVSKGLLPKFIPNPIEGGEINLVNVIPWALLVIAGFGLVRAGRCREVAVVTLT